MPKIGLLTLPAPVNVFGCTYTLMDALGEAAPQLLAPTAPALVAALGVTVAITGRGATVETDDTAEEAVNDHAPLLVAAGAAGVEEDCV